MRKVNKIINIALIFMLIGVFLGQEFAYARPITSKRFLRVPIGSGGIFARIGDVMGLQRKAEDFCIDRKYDRAKDCIEAAIKIDPDNLNLYITKIYIYDALHKKEEVLEALQEVLSLARKKGRDKQFIYELREMFILLEDYRLLDEEWDFVNERWFKPWVIEQKDKKSDVYQYLEHAAKGINLAGIHIKDLARLVREDLDKDRSLCSTPEWNGQFTEMLVGDWLGSLIIANLKYKKKANVLQYLFSDKKKESGRNCFSGSIGLLLLGRAFGLDIDYLHVSKDNKRRSINHAANSIRVKQGENKYKIKIIDTAYETLDIRHKRVGKSEASYKRFLKNSTDNGGSKYNLYTQLLFYQADNFFKKATNAENNARKIMFYEKSLEMYRHIAMICDVEHEYWWNANMSKIYHGLGQYELAVSYGEKVNRDMRNDPEFHRILGWSYYRIGKFNNAIKQFKKIRKKSVTIYFKLRPTYYAKQEIKKAIKLSLGLGRMFYRQKNYDRAIEHFKLILQAAPRSYRDEIYGILARCYYGLKRYDNALTQLKKIHKKTADNYAVAAKVFAVMGKNKEVIKSGLIFYKQKDYDRAIESLLLVMDSKSACKKVFTVLGWCYYAKGSYNQAISYFNKAIEVKQKMAGAYLGLGWSYYRLGDYDKAVRNFKESEKFGTVSLGNSKYKGLGLAYYKQGKYKEALRELRLVSSKDSADLRFYFGRAYMSMGEFKKARRQFEKSLKLNPEQSSVREMLKSIDSQSRLSI